MSAWPLPTILRIPPSRRHRACSAVAGAVILPVLLGFFLAAIAAPVLGADVALETLRTADQVRRLSAEQAARHYPVQLRGVLTFFDQTNFFRFVQDETAGIYFYLDDSTPHEGLAAGQIVEIKGETSPGEYAPIVETRSVRILSQGAYPSAKPVTFEQLASGQQDSQFVQVRGIVRAAYFDQPTKYFSIDLATGGGRLTAFASKLPVPPGELADSIVKVTGVCVTRFNHLRQLFDIRLLVPRTEDLLVEQPAARDPFAVPVQSIGSLLRFTPEGTYGHRVKVFGTVIYRRNDTTLYVEDETEGLCVETKQAGALAPGDRVELLGFPAKGDYTPMLQDAVFRKASTGPPPNPDAVTADEALKGTHDCRLIRVEGTVLDRARHTGEQFLVLQVGGFIFQAYLEHQGPGLDFSYLENGSKVAVTGVCRIETGTDWHAGEDWRAKSFRVLLRSPADVFMLRRPPWWTLQKMLWAVGLLIAVVLAAFAWVAILRRRVYQQTGIIRRQLQTEAALKERYEDLFENANDIVFTHDLSGRLTSINKAGERLLQFQREQIVSRKLVDLLVEEQRADAVVWIEEVIKGSDLPAAEWDFVTAAGQRVKLEISSRRVEQAGKPPEVEGVARDITERKRLEKEILDVSNREQRRIGHDLHDGVCQQLVAIAYLTDILADRLLKKGEPASREAEKIGGLINEAISQTRSVARGLFPVRLEENGLASALEELAANAGNLFKIKCIFSCPEPLSEMENGAALHLYYIAQEAVLNAAKHGRATRASILLLRIHDRFVLTVQDDGAGFELPGTNLGGMGIRIMRYRARVIGATLDLKSQPGRGTQVTCTFYPTAREPGRASADERNN
jgi:PAS domain S-box-containing protein